MHLYRSPKTTVRCPHVIVDHSTTELFVPTNANKGELEIGRSGDGERTDGRQRQDVGGGVGGGGGRENENALNDDSV